MDTQTIKKEDSESESPTQIEAEIKKEVLIESESDNEANESHSSEEINLLNQFFETMSI